MIFNCPQCHKNFDKPPSDKPTFCSRFCYDKSREGHYICSNCGEKFIDYKCRKRIFCSDKCQRSYMVADKHPRWKGGKTIRHGHILVYKPNHPFSTNGYIFEHRLVMEEKVNRYLKSEEIVHHINYIKTDNRIENLVILTRSEHVKIHPPK